MVDLGDVIEGLKGSDFFREWDQVGRHHQARRIGNKLGVWLCISVYPDMFTAICQDIGTPRNRMSGTLRVTFDFFAVRKFNG